MALLIRIKLHQSYRALPSCQAWISEIDKVQCKPKILYQSSLIAISLTALSNFIDPPKVLLNFIRRMMSVAGLWQVFLWFGTKPSTFYYFSGFVPQTACLSMKSPRTTLFLAKSCPRPHYFSKNFPQLHFFVWLYVIYLLVNKEDQKKEIIYCCSLKSM